MGTQVLRLVRDLMGQELLLGTGIERGQGDHGGVLTVDGPYIKKFIVKHHMKKDLKLRIGI